MPIKGLTDDVKPRYPRLGKLRKGAEMKEGGPGKDLEYFRFTSDDPRIEEAFAKRYGDKPASLLVFLPHTTAEEAFSTWCEVWGSSGLIHRCDGENMTVWLEGNKYVMGNKPCDASQHTDGDPLNDAVGRLDLILPELLQEGFVGYVTITTHSKHDILNISSLLAQVEQASKSGIGLRGIPFILSRVETQVSTPGFGKTAGKRTRSTKWLLNLAPVSDWVKASMEQMQKDALMLQEPLPVSIEEDTTLPEVVPSVVEEESTVEEESNNREMVTLEAMEEWRKLCTQATKLGISAPRFSGTKLKAMTLEDLREEYAKLKNIVNKEKGNNK